MHCAKFQNVWIAYRVYTDQNKALIQYKDDIFPV